MESSKTLGINVDDHFRELTKMIALAKGAQRGIKPEEPPPAENIKKVERRVAKDEKEMLKETAELPKDSKQ